MDRKALSGLFMLDCAFDREGNNSKECCRCERLVSELPTEPNGYEHWPACPNRLRLMPVWQSIVEGWNDKEIDGLHGWPYAHVAYFVWGIRALAGAFAKKREHEDKENAPPAGSGFPGAHNGPPARRGPVYRGPNPWQ